MTLQNVQNISRLQMESKEIKLKMLTIGRNALITAIMALDEDYYVNDLEDLRDSVNSAIKELEKQLKE